jgi:endonuclease III
MKTLIDDLPELVKILKKEFHSHPAPIIELIEAQTKDPFAVLVGTILSSRTKDACTAGAVKRLFAAGGNTPEGLEKMELKTLEKLIYPVGF